MAKKICDGCHGLGNWVCCKGAGFTEVPDEPEPLKGNQEDWFTFASIPTYTPSGGQVITIPQVKPTTHQQTAVRSPPKCTGCGGSMSFRGPSPATAGRDLWCCLPCYSFVSIPSVP